MDYAQKLLKVIELQSEIAVIGHDLTQIMDFVVEKSQSLMECDGAAIELNEVDDMVYRSVSGVACHFLGLRLKTHGSLSGLCVLSGEPQICQDTEIDDRVDRVATRKIGIRSMLVIPLTYDQEVVGVLKVMSKQENWFDEESLRVLSLISKALGSAIYYATRWNERDLYYLATHDVLTSLANRSHFMERLRHLKSQRRHDDSRFGVVMIDMNGLKYLNDNFGHKIGDIAIQALAEKIIHSTRDSDLAARLGGDEFAIIVMPVSSGETLDTIKQRIVDSFAQPFELEGKTYPLSASIGYSVFPDESQDIEVLIDLADQRMYDAKKQYYNQLQ